MLATQLCLSVLATLTSSPVPALARCPNGVVRLASHVLRYDVTSDGRRAVFLTDAATAGTQELYTVTTRGLDAPLRLNQDLLGRVHDFRISPAGTHVAYLGDRDQLGQYQLFLVPSDGSAAPLELSGRLPDRGSVYTLQFSPDGTRIVYLARQDSPLYAEIYSVPADGSAPPVKLNDRLMGTDGVTFYLDTITPDSSAVLYFAPLVREPFRALFVAPIDGGAAALQIGFGNPTSLGSLQVASGSDRAVFHVLPAAGGTDDGLYSTALDGSSAPVRLDPGTHVQDYRITADGSRVVFRDGSSSPNLPRLLSVPVDGGIPVELSGTDPVDQYVQGSFQLTPDGSRALYIADERANYRFELFSVPTTGGTSQRINAPLTGNVRGVLVDPTGARAVYVGTHSLAGGMLKSELFSVPVSGGGALRISSPMTPGRGVAYALTGGGYRPAVVIHPLGDEVLYLADQDADDVFELYRTPIDGHTPPEKVNGPLVHGGDVQNVFMQEDFRYGAGRQVFFRAEATTVGDFELFATTRSRVQPAKP